MNAEEKKIRFILAEEEACSTQIVKTSVLYDEPGVQRKVDDIVFDHTKNLWAVRYESKGDYEWHFNFFRHGLAPQPLSLDMNLKTHDLEIERGRWVANGHNNLERRLRVLRVYEYDPEDLTHAVLTADATEYVAEEWQPETMAVS